MNEMEKVLGTWEMQRRRRERQAQADHLLLAVTQTTADLYHVDSTSRLVQKRVDKESGKAKGKAEIV